ncbi:DNA-binding transcriptional regulator, LysR family [Desulfofundulus australicus DSM 11792]|uniref:DNA-binding transcriptional regulator, LysR family n=1 Tax=Desulfofundulus australicus DSM 11792 TaxID=1121425 RepID=A0A1M4U0I1_9FIRM|nr:selenium metabolism-associated LysR family transcriptional regulator [Desulfofundulus australicus]SHE50235.1 DNA-binding transcriptional regulator, LysR family [Desulfofundulus australicus DSM 11792]
MNLKQLEAFLRVAELQSFTKAAKHLYMSQPAISFQIRSLEESLGTTLFYRGDKKVELTEAGRLLYPEAQQILRHFQKIKSELDELKGLKKGHLILGASTIPGEYLLPLLIGRFHRDYPGIEVTMRIAGSSQVIRWVQEREIDLGITGAPVKEDGLECLPWYQDRLVLIVGPEHPWINRDAVSPAELLTQPLILREPGSGTRRSMEEKMAQVGLSVRDAQVVMELGSTRAVITAVQAGLGISLVSALAAAEPLALKRVYQVTLKELDLTRYLYLVHVKEWPLSFAAGAFWDYITKEGETGK